MKQSDEGTSYVIKWTLAVIFIAFCIYQLFHSDGSLLAELSRRVGVITTADILGFGVAATVLLVLFVARRALVAIAVGVGVLWVVVSLVRYFWEHSLF